jgi:hypothetical protein
MMMTGAYGQLLDNDTLYISEVSGEPGEQVIISVDIKTSEEYAGWQVPIIFGTGTSPVVCDSVNFDGSIMTDTTFRPEGWDFIAPFVNNNEWGNVQTCGVAGVIWLSPPTQNLPAGTYHIMDLYFTIDDTASVQTIVLDTMGAAWYPGGPVNHYIVVVPPGYSRTTHVEQGAIHITGYGVDEEISKDVRAFTLSPSVVRAGEMITIRSTHDESLPLLVVDATGRVVDRIKVAPRSFVSYKTGALESGVFFITNEQDRIQSAEKVVIY